MEVHTETCQFMSRLYFQRYFSPFTVLLKSKLVRLLSALYWFAVGCTCGGGSISFRSHRKALPGEEVLQQWDPKKQSSLYLSEEVGTYRF